VVPFRVGRWDSVIQGAFLTNLWNVAGGMLVSLFMVLVDDRTRGNIYRVCRLLFLLVLRVLVEQNWTLRRAD
jgi:hypothetical protein